ncbi:MAG: sulfotransferase [Planctomycetota bacterium]
MSADANTTTGIKPPFFIAGCARSGTTILRDLLRRVPHLECPEETHFFRWPDPFRTKRYGLYFQNIKLFARHRELDNITDSEFVDLLDSSFTRAELMERYARLHCRRRGNPNARWFDKTPQNVYGILMIAAQFPASPIIHIHRNPLNVVASLLTGKVMPKQPFPGAVNYWLESAQIMDQFRRANPQRLLDVSYERLGAEPDATLREILEFVGEDPAAARIKASDVHPEKNKYTGVMTQDQIDEVCRRCEPYMARLGYHAPQPAGAAPAGAGTRG